MAVVDIFSKRQKALRGEIKDVYQYAEIPHALRVQIVHLLRDLFGEHVQYDSNHCLSYFQSLSDVLTREYGMFVLSREPMVDRQVVDFVLKIADCEQVIDVVELSFRSARRWLGSGSFIAIRSEKKLDAAVEELNTRFREHGVGYQYESGEMIRVDSQLIHAEVVKPVLALLSANEYAGANAEFLTAHEHYRKGDTKECLNECLKAFESTMKAICEKHGWPYKPTDTAAALIGICLQNELIPQELQSHFSAVRATLESGIPTIRNRRSAHGQGAQVIEVPEHYASYMLHLTATTIKFLVQAEKALD